MHYLSKIKKDEIYNKICLLRADLNIEQGMEKNAFRLQTIIPTIQFLLKNKCKVVIVSHRGRPMKNTEYTRLRRQGIQNIGNEHLSLKPFAWIIAKQIKKPVAFLSNPNLKRFNLLKLKKDVVLLENLRFWKGEEKNDEKFAKQLASLADFYVNDAFPVCHRKNASVVAITKFLPSYAGLRLEKEIKNLDAIMKNPAHPLTVIIGGAKIADKLGVVKNFQTKADYFLFGSNLVDALLATKDNLRPSQALILLPIDFKKSDSKILDIGQKTIKEYSKIIQKSRTIIWNGPMGLFENKKFAGGTIAIWKAIFVKCKMSNVKCHAVIGGGETIESLKLLNSQFPACAGRYILNFRNVFLSTGGTAMLEYLSGKKLAGINALR